MTKEEALKALDELIIWMEDNRYERNGESMIEIPALEHEEFMLELRMILEDERE